MRASGRRLAFAACISALGLVAAACGGSNNDGGGGSTSGGGLSGTITISGSSTVQPISSLVAELFNETNPDAKVSVDGPGTTDGFVLFCDGKTDIQDASRPIEPEEVKACQKGGVHYEQLEVALDGITVMTNPDNSDVKCLNFGDLYALFGPESQGFDNWSDADELANKVGGTDSFPDAPLEITAPGEESGTYDAFIELAGISDTAAEQGVPEKDAESLRPDYTSSPNDNVIIQAMEGSPSSLGFVGFAFADQAGSSVEKVEIDGGDGCIAPTKDTIADGSYPISRSLFIYVNTDKLAQNPATKGYVDLYVSSEGLNTAVDQSDYVVLPADRQKKTQAAWGKISS